MLHALPNAFWRPVGALGASNGCARQRTVSLAKGSWRDGEGGVAVDEKHEAV